MGSIGIVGLGVEQGGALAPGTLERLRAADHVVVPSGEGEAAELVGAAGVEFSTFADLGLATGASSASIADALAEMSADGVVVLATAGYPFLRAGMVSGLLERASGPVDVFPVDSPLGVLVLAFDIDLTADAEIVDVSGLAARRSDRDAHLVVTGVLNKVQARRASEYLERDYPREHPVVIAGCLDDGGFDLLPATVGTLAEVENLCADTTLYLPPSRPDLPGDFDELVRIIATLRGPDGCPWDREQTHTSLRRHVIEEAYEVVSAIEADDEDALADELGDLLLQIVLQAQIASEEGRFDIGDVTAGITTKLRRRHPHVFGGVEVADADEVTRNWDAIKRGEKEGVSVLDGVPAGLPSLARAQKISKRAAGAGFEWETVADVWDKVHEEIEELKEARVGGPHVAEELGDVLFTMVNVARKLGVDAEIALREACDKFSRRFTAMENAATAAGRGIRELGTDEMERLWHDAKQEERADSAR